MTDPALSLDLCICTFRRAHIADTLRSVAAMNKAPNLRLHIIVADNDDTPSARNIIEEAARECHLDLTYIHAPARNISIARNACLAAATEKLVAFIDDDELVSPQWLDEMTGTLQMTKADVVMGPVIAVYGASAPQWMKDGNFHSTIPVRVNGRVTTGGSGNVLMRRDSAVIAGRRFHTDLGKSGGEDSEFFAAVQRAGGTIAFAERAIVTEEVEPARATMRWLMQRRIRYGQTHGFLILTDGGGGFVGRLTAIMLAGAKSFIFFIAALFNIINPPRMRYWLLRGALHLGVVIHLAGGRTIEPYGGGAQP
ncbi:MAG: glycosyl transferase family [Micavibrio sp.]|nr:glycosyl transferase family [Micavibrio sp.]